MDAFDELRKLALSKRDEAIKTARDECARRLAEIDSLRRALGVEGRRTNPGQPMAEMICDLIPQDRTFMVAEILEGLREAEPDREFTLPSVNACIHSLKDHGMVKRVSRGDKGQAVWAAAGLDVEECPYGAKPLTDVAEAIIRDRGPMTAVDLVLEMQRQGYRVHAKPMMLVRSLGTTLKRSRERFAVDAQRRWRLVDA